MSIDPSRKIEAQFDLTKPVAVDHARGAQLFSNLLGNALTHGASPSDTLSHLFQPFFRGKVRPSQQGLGLGLYIASEIAK
jgi:sigma-B regulation protein RsbU (phosphoserine phosphatase)